MMISPLSLSEYGRDRGSKLGIVSALEELHQHGNQDFVCWAVVLTLKAAMLCIGEDICERLRPVVHKRRALSPVHHERRHCDGGLLVSRQRVA
jgi:hypothetical protein